MLEIDSPYDSELETYLEKKVIQLLFRDLSLFLFYQMLLEKILLEFVIFNGQKYCNIILL
jgi:hypothetical protein